MVLTSTENGEDKEIQATFANLIERHESNLFADAMCFTRNRTDAEDLLQETFMRAFVGFKRSQDIENPKAWLFKIMRNAFINHYHKKRRQPTHVSYEEGLAGFVDDALISTDGDPAETFFSRFLDQEIEDALGSLPGQFREAVVLCAISGLTSEEIVQVLDCPLGTVRSRIFRGRELLFQKLYGYAKERGILKEQILIA